METDIVDPGMFLRGCGEPLGQYRECLMKNLKDWSGRGLHRGKLSMVKIHQLCQMNITRFDHQKLIMARIRELPDIPSMPAYNVDQKEPAELEAAVHLQRRSRGNRISTSSSTDSASQGLSDESTTSGTAGTGTADSNRRRSVRHGKGVKGGRRGSMAIDRTWDSINKSRAELDGAAKQKQLGNIRRRKSNIGLQPPEIKPLKRTDTGDDTSAGESVLTRGGSNESLTGTGAKSGGSRRQSISVHNPDPAKQAEREAAKAKRQRAIEYGNSALKATVREGHLKELKKQILAEFVSTIGCDRATLMFVDTPSQELFFFDGNTRISFPLRKGISGNCAETGVGAIVNDPYSNEFFNAQIDKDTGFSTRNVLCAPIKSRKGGNVVAVLEMVNKKNGQDFTEQDADVMEMCTVRVARALDTSFSALVEAENDWGKAPGRRRSSSIDGVEEIQQDATQAAAAAAGGGPSADGSGQTGSRRASLGRRGSAIFGGEEVGSQEFREPESRHQISNRKGSGASRADVEKLKRRTDYGKEVRDSSVGLL